MVSAIVSFLLCLFGVILLVVILFFAAAIKNIPENEQWVVSRLGDTFVKGPGRFIQIPMLDRVTRVNLGQLPTNIQDQTCITQDRAPVIVHMLVYSRVVDPIKYASGPARPREDFAHLASSALKETVGAHMLDELLSDREGLGSAVCAKLEGEIDPALGVRIEKVKILDVVVSKEVLAARAASAANVPSECPACGAPLPDQAGKWTRQIKCEYCGFLIKL
jgi:regulator of protease activity HflC (stomatin/prohibitin superfamily)